MCKNCAYQDNTICALNEKPVKKNCKSFENPEDIVMSSGKYRLKTFKDMPRSYLSFLSNNSKDKSIAVAAINYLRSLSK